MKLYKFILMNTALVTASMLKNLCFYVVLPAYIFLFVYVERAGYPSPFEESKGEWSCSSESGYKVSITSINKGRARFSITFKGYDIILSGNTFFENSGFPSIYLDNSDTLTFRADSLIGDADLKNSVVVKDFYIDISNLTIDKEFFTGSFSLSYGSQKTSHFISCNSF